jgi:hypothetical protein
LIKEVEVKDELVIVFENCEVAHILVADIAYLNVSGITESVSYSAHNGFRTLKNAKEFSLCIKNPRLSVVSRCIKYKDITQLSFAGETYLIEWVGDSDYENENQRTIFHKENNVLSLECNGRDEYD